MKIDIKPPFVPFYGYFQVNVPFGGFYQPNAAPEHIPFMGFNITGDDDGCTRIKSVNPKVGKKVNTFA